VSKERARRRTEREREAAMKAAARAAEAERRERRAARARAVRRRTTDRLPRPSPRGRDTGALAQRRRVETSLLVAMLVAVNVVVWVVRPDAQARVGVLVVSALAFPVLHLLLLPRR
jgi:Flp pilus assembly protein TadB